MAEQNKTVDEVLKSYSPLVRIIIICFLPALVIHMIVGCFLPEKQKVFWKKHILGISVGITALAVIVLVSAVLNTNPPATENTSNSTGEISQVQLDEEEKITAKEEAVSEEGAATEETEKIEEEAKKAEEEEKARLAEEEKAKKATEEAERQKQKEAALQEQMARAPAAFANPLGHVGEIIAVRGSIIVEYAYRPNDKHKYTDSLPVGADGWGGFWIDTQYGKCYAMYRGYAGPQKEYHTGDVITFVGKVVSDESTYEPMSGIYAPLWLSAWEDF